MDERDKPALCLSLPALEYRECAWVGNSECGRFSAVWDGGERENAVRNRPDPGTHAPAVSHFGSGTLTFHMPCLFKTDSGTDLFVTGPLNRPKDGIAALTVETDWSPYTFAMNWRFTRAGH